MSEKIIYDTMHVSNRDFAMPLKITTDDLYQCDACGKLVPADEVKGGMPAAGVEGTFCHECRHGKNCDCNAD